jgi:hypothetical protein
MDFERAEYLQAEPMEGQIVGRPVAASGMSAFPLALLFGAVAAVVGSIGYALVGLTGFMVSIVAIGVAWLIAKAMLTASGGVGGRPYQIAAVVLTYFAVSCGELIHPLWTVVEKGVPILRLLPVFLKYALLGPFLELQDGINGVLGLIILGIGIRAAWKMAAGGPGFGNRATRMG